ncbi:MAG: right-handed parallel beta-helix repeat-containing protein [Thermoplasmata archaeon]|nr:right-handed parallel beta-helix repeat-containing protein [Thermoplasmata archaeon]
MLLFFLLFQLFIPISYAQTPPPLAGDWIISDTTVIENQTIILRGDLRITEAGSLTLLNSSLFIDCAYPGQHGIFVEGGVLRGFNSTFAQYRDNFFYVFDTRGEVELEKCRITGLHLNGIHATGGTLTLVSSSLYGNTLYGAAVGGAGDSLVTLEDCEIYNNTYGIVAWDNTTMFVNSTDIHDNAYDGLEALGSSRVFALSSSFHGNGWNGAYGGDSGFMRLESCTMSSNTRDGVAVKYDSRAEVFNGSSSFNGRNGLSAVGSAYMTAVSVLLDGNANDGVLCQQDSQTFLESVTITGSGRNGIIASLNATFSVLNCSILSNSRNGIEVQDYVECSVKGSRVEGSGNVGVLLSYHSRTVMEDNVILSNDDKGLAMRDYARATSTGDNISFNGDYGVILYDNSELDMLDGAVWGNAQDGIEVQDGAELDMMDSVSGGNTGNGLFVLNYASVRSTGGLFLGNGENGIKTQLLSQGSVEITGGMVEGNDVSGIAAFLPSTPVFRNVTVRDSGVVGVFIADGASPLIDGCTVNTSGSYGIYVRDVSQPHIYNSSIADSGEYDIWAGNGSEPVFISTIFDRASMYFNDTSSRVWVGWWVAVEVEDENGTAAEGAAVNATDLLGETLFLGTADENGRVGPLPLLTVEFSSQGETPLSPHNFTASLGDLEGNITVDVEKDMTVRIVLHRRPGLMEPSSLVLDFLGISDGETVTGLLSFTVKCSPVIDRVEVYVTWDNGGKRELVASGSPTGGVFHAEWDTSGTRGEATIEASGYNTTLGVNVTREITVFVSNTASAPASVVGSMILGSVVALAGAGLGAYVGGGGISDGLGEYAEERMFDMERRRRGLGGYMGMTIGVLALSLFSAASAGGLLSGGGYSSGALGLLVAAALLPTVVIVLVMETLEARTVRRLGGGGGFSLWPFGLLMLLLTSLLFSSPFGSPGKTKTSGSVEARGASALIKVLSAPLLLLMFAPLYMSDGFWRTAGGFGISLSLMLMVVDSLPVDPLEGRRMLSWNPAVWLGVMLSGLALFLLWSLSYIPAVWLLAPGVVSLAAVVLVYRGVGGKFNAPEGFYGGRGISGRVEP